MSDFAAPIIVLAGALCQVFYRKLPRGLGTSLFVCATTVGLAWGAFEHGWPTEPSPYLAYLVVSTLAALWAGAGFLIRKGWPASKDGNELSAGFFAWSLVSGIAAVSLTLYILVFSTWSRIVEPRALVSTLALLGLWHILMLVLAVLLWVSARPHELQPAMLLSLGGLFAWWTALMMSGGTPLGSPTLGASIATTSGGISELMPTWWTWTLQLQVGLSIVLFFAALLQEQRYRYRRKQAWPDRLDDLIAPYSRWPAYTRIEALLAAAILLCGVYELVQGGLPSWKRDMVAAFAVSIAGVTCLMMTYRRWSANTTGLGLSLITLAVVSFACALSSLMSVSHGAREYAARMPTVFNAVLVGLLIMIMLWRWLAALWEQQLLDGVPWTTAGRMIPYNRRTAFLLSALAALIALQMALWPESITSGYEDRGTGRMLCGLFTLAALAAVELRIARRDQSTTHAGLATIFAVAAVLFVFFRLPASPLRGWVKQYDAVVYAAIALPILTLAEAMPRSNWRAFATPFWLLALLVLPAAALSDLLSGPQPAEWVRPLTLAILGAVYSFAASREHRRAFLVLGGVLLLASLTSVYTSYRTLLPHSHSPTRISSNGYWDRDFG